ncbi:MAG: hypothetical protein IH586_14470, partial [Anaerolineaceae bacterium]|nr:hypothetical protein [Anaerolineaceae bacterium]
MNQDHLHSFYNDLNHLGLENNWPALEQHFFHIAAARSDPNLIDQIKTFDLDPYTAGLIQFLKDQFSEISFHAVKAFYFEYDPTSLWKGTLFICDRYSPLRSANDEWARHWIQKAAGPKLPEFAEWFQQQGGFNHENEAQIGITFYLIARMIAAYGRAIESLPLTRAAIC